MGSKKIKNWLSRITGFSTPFFGLSWNPPADKDHLQNEKGAILRPKLIKAGNSYRLYLINSGENEARDIQVFMDDIPLGKHGVSIQNDPMPTMVGAGSEISCALAITFGNTPPFEIEIKWDDDSGDGNEYRTTLTF